MRSRPSAVMNVIKKEDKETRLKDFILRDILARKVDGTSAPAGAYHLMALSAESPVARAIASLAAEIAEAGVLVEAVFARLDASSCGATVLGLGSHASIRRATDARLLDAHEQLVMGPETVWIGDCMRRDPAKRDAYECYSEGCDVTSAWAKRSFERIWAGAQPVDLVRAEPAPEAPVELPFLDPLVAAIGEPGPVTAATRH